MHPIVYTTACSVCDLFRIQASDLPAFGVHVFFKILVFVVYFWNCSIILVVALKMTNAWILVMYFMFPACFMV